MGLAVAGPVTHEATTAQVLVGVEQVLQPEWHTYWINPGDTGVPTRIAWNLPAGASAGPIPTAAVAPLRHVKFGVSKFGVRALFSQIRGQSTFSCTIFAASQLARPR